MNLKDAYEFFDELDDLDHGGSTKSNKKVSKKRESKKLETDARLFVRAQEVAREFKFTYKAARFEEAWLLSSLEDIADHRWVSDVLRKVKAGKEASVYLCKAGAALPGAEFVVAKVYRPRTLRNLRNDGMYRAGRPDLDDEGRIVIDDGMQHAMQKKTDYGRELLHQSWIAYEFTSMQELYAAGADVPKPHAMSSNVIVMDFIGGDNVSAPTLSDVKLARSEARVLFERIMHNVDILLAHERIHGDLSAYNILYWDGDITLIDFPQVVSPKANRHAFEIFQRDVKRVCDYFVRQGVQADARNLAISLWTSHGYRATHDEDDAS